MLLLWKGQTDKLLNTDDKYQEGKDISLDHTDLEDIKKETLTHLFQSLEMQIQRTNF